MVKKHNIQKELKTALDSIKEAQAAIESLMDVLPEYTNAPECNVATPLDKSAKENTPKKKP